jgi:hypothetical protein
VVRATRTSGNHPEPDPDLSSPNDPDLFLGSEEGRMALLAEHLVGWADELGSLERLLEELAHGPCSLRPLDGARKGHACGYTHLVEDVA